MTPIGRLFIISAPSGGGKTTVAKRALLALQTSVPIEKVVTYTTRPPRSKERDGVDYHFVDATDFASRKKEGFFLETTEYDGHCYGSPRNILDQVEAGRSFLFVTDRPGAQAIKALYPKAILIWLEVPSLEVLEHRLAQREKETPATLKRRIALAREEIAAEHKTQLFNIHLVNDDLARVTLELVQLIERSLSNS